MYEPALADCYSEAAVQARRDGPSLFSAPDYKIYTVSQKKHVTTFSAITLTISVRLQ